MKKLLGFTLSLASIGFVAGSGEVKAAEAAVSPTSLASSAQPQWQNRRSRSRSRVRVVNRTRLVRYNRALYRETYQIRYLPNGRTTTRIISRVRVR